MEWKVNGIHNGLPRRLTRLRNEATLTRQELADKAGVTFNTINDIERGRRRRPMEKTLQSIAQVLEVPYEYLVYGKVTQAEASSPSAASPSHARRRLLRRGAYIAAGIAIAGIAAFHVQWERTQFPSAYECVVNAPYEGVADVRFDDVDGCGMVEAVYSSSAKRSWNVSKFDRTRSADWRLLPVLTSDESDGARTNLFVHDANGDEWKDIITLHQDGSEEELLVLDGRDGDLLRILCRPDSATICPGDEWQSEKRVVAITRDDTLDSQIVLVSTAARSTSVASSLCGIDLNSGAHVWKHASESVLQNVVVSDLDYDGRPETLVWGQSTHELPENALVTRASVSVIDSEGDAVWRRNVGQGIVDVTGCLLQDNAKETPIVVAAVNNRAPAGFAASYILLLNATNGARIDSLSYTAPIVNEPLARRHPGEPSWEIFCGTLHGSIRKYSATDRHIRLEGETWIGHDWVWPWGFVADDELQGEIIVATADNISFIVDADLNVLLRRPAHGGATISPLASFADPSGTPYVAFLCHGADLCIDRIVSNSGWGRRSWYIIAYVLPLLALAVIRKALM